MEQAKANQISFRELDQDGNPLDPEAASSVRDSSGSAAREPGRVSVNPFIVLLCVLASVLAGGGVWVYAEVISPPVGAYGPVDEMPLTFVLMNFTPYAVLSGTLAIVGLLFWHAVQWQRTRQ